jgi:hypothetical protein
VTDSTLGSKVSPVITLLWTTSKDVLADTAVGETARIIALPILFPRTLTSHELLNPLSSLNVQTLLTIVAMSGLDDCIETLVLFVAVDLVKVNFSSVIEFCDTLY